MTSDYRYEVFVHSECSRKDLDIHDIRVLWPHENRNQLLHFMENNTRLYLETMAIADPEKYEGAVISCTCLVNEADNPDTPLERHTFTVEIPGLKPAPKAEKMIKEME